ncbi:polysaccharide deacetylase family protein, partial [Planctomycetota bacterium]
MRAGLVLAVFSVLSGSGSADANRLAHLDRLDPYYVSTDFAKLVTPQWVGDPDVDCVVVLAIDDMRDVAKYENYLRPILNRLKKIDGRAPVSIMSNRVNLNDSATASQLQSWLDEGVSVEVHTIDHPCPLLCDNDFAKAKSTYDRCVDLMDSIPNNRAVAFRMPCCDSLNTPSPRFWNEIFEKTTPNGKHLSIDSSVFCIINDDDAEVQPQQAFDSDGRPKFQKYLPFPSFVNTIQNYPYPYVIGRTCWEFPCMVPSDWEAQNLHRPNNPQTVDDMKTALDVVVEKKGTYSLVFHPHGWIRADQIVKLIDHAVSKHGNRVKFMTFRECDERIRENLLSGHPLRSRVDASGSSISDIRILDLNGDGYQDVVRLDRVHQKIHGRVWRPAQKDWIEASATFDGLLPRFGVLSKSNAGSIVYVSKANHQLAAITWQDSGAWHGTEIST